MNTKSQTNKGLQIVNTVGVGQVVIAAVIMAEEWFAAENCPHRAHL